MRVLKTLGLLALVLATGAAAPEAGDTAFMPGVISTEAAEVRLAISPDGQRMLWGSIGRDGAKDAQDIWERHAGPGGLSAPARVSFDTAAVEFDPAFSPDGRTVYFHSDRPGGLGGTDIYAVALDPASGRFGAPRNLGPSVNSAGDEWAPTPTKAGTLIFASDGWGGQGRHDLFEAKLKGPSRRPASLGPGVNSADEDFDAALSPDGRTLVFSSGRMDGDSAEARLYRSVLKNGVWGPRARFAVGCSDFAIGSAMPAADPVYFYYAANCPGGQGRMDIRQVRMPDLK